jgi:hypothetical protein
MRALFKLGFDLVEAGIVILLDTVCCGIANQCAMAGMIILCMAIILFSSFRHVIFIVMWRPSGHHFSLLFIQYDSD